MNEDQSNIERILDLTLEIIYLLTGEGYAVVKKTSGEHVTSSRLQRVSEEWRETQRQINVPSAISPTVKRNNEKMILEVIKKIIELLTGEVPIRCQDVTVYFSMEEWEYLEGHKELYKDVMMEDQQMFNYENLGKNTFCLNEMILDLTLEITCLLTGEDCALVMMTSFEKNLERRSHHKRLKERSMPITWSPLPFASLKEDKVREFTVKMMELLTGEVPIRCQDVTVYFSMEEWEYLEGHKDLFKDVMMASQPALTSPGGRLLQDSCEEPLTFSVHDNGIERHPGVNRITGNIYDRTCCLGKLIGRSNPEDSSSRSHSWMPDIDLGSYSADRATDTTNPEECAFAHEEAHTMKSLLSCSGCGKSFELKSKLLTHLRCHNELTVSWSEHGKTFPKESKLLTHKTTQNPYSCPECGKGFLLENIFLKHQKMHTSELTYSCLACGKFFTQKGDFFRHQRSHTGERPYSCSECGKCFAEKAKLLIHHRTHTGERPYSCSECGKGFSRSTELLRHRRIHTGESPFSCSECGKCFNVKANLLLHQRIHTGERPFSCSECGQSFDRKTNLLRHHRSHTGESPFECSDCGQCFTRKLNLLRHQKKHTDRSPLSCPECGKCYWRRNNLNRHRRTHNS